jgi:hypothetical protein
LADAGRIKIRPSEHQISRSHGPAAPIMAGDPTGDQFDDASLLISERRESTRRAHTSGACFSMMDATSTKHQRLIVILIEGFSHGTRIRAA